MTSYRVLPQKADFHFHFNKCSVLSTLMTAKSSNHGKWSFKLSLFPVILTAPCGLSICLCSCYQNLKDLFPPFITQGKIFSSLSSRYIIIAALKPFIVFYFPCSHVEMACGVIQVVLKKVAIVIRRTSKGNKLEILAISFLVDKIRLNSMINA